MGCFCYYFLIIGVFHVIIEKESIQRKRMAGWHFLNYNSTQKQQQSAKSFQKGLSQDFFSKNSIQFKSIQFILYSIRIVFRRFTKAVPPGKHISKENSLLTGRNPEQDQMYKDYMKHSGGHKPSSDVTKK